ncbi:hypothetical protein Tsubulata_023128 [Turnera subulata]|uniref:Uncharacterized protein n=1 Tax=Turnera subulata TaxID=218843 RepID=A0A9Q0J074_9ROSI|nr:hypothetical protein Tsubulata_023128 [Turnera subulata]
MRCSKGKRKTIDSNKNQNDVHDGNPQKTADKAPGLESNSLPISSASPVTTNTEELNGKKQDKEECTVAGSWLPNAQSMNFYVESPAVQGHLDDEPFTPYLDSIVLLTKCDAMKEEFQEEWTLHHAHRHRYTKPLHP